MVDGHGSLYREIKGTGAFSWLGRESDDFADALKGPEFSPLGRRAADLLRSAQNMSEHQINHIVGCIEDESGASASTIRGNIDALLRRYPER